MKYKLNTLLWFQRDLRLTANPSLNWALQRGKPVIALYVYSIEEEKPWQSGPASNWWLYQSLQTLSVKLQQHDIKLHFFKSNSQTKIPELVFSYKADAVCWTNRHEPQRILCEAEIERTLTSRSILVKRFEDGLLTNTDNFLTQTKKTPYRIFTPFYKRLRQQLNPSAYHYDMQEPQWPHSTASVDKDMSALDNLDLLDSNSWHSKLSHYWSPGEESALEKLDYFITKSLENYSYHKEIPGINGTSTLSPHLHFGEISPHQILTALAPLITFSDSNRSNSAENFFRQLCWREFARYILRHFPNTADESMNKSFTESFWQADQVNLHLWQHGNTGVPIIDAGMQQLWETGWMHNRIRMLTASFLTKNLGISWQEGARWFWHTLVDADLANNSMGWQWVAGCGVDAATYFRIFNPYSQTQRFDKDHLYINRWNRSKGKNSSTQAIVDVSQSRKDALLRYQQLRQLDNVTKSD